MRAHFDYYANGWLHFVTYLNGAQTEYTYDAAGRLTVIDHRDDLGVSFLKLTYGYDNRDLPTSITEESGGVQMAQTDFGYDARGRLTSEMRGGTSAYHLVYEYDKGGNRTRKTDVDNAVEVVYQYDINYPWGPNDEPSANNRLMRYVTCDVSAPGAVCDLNGASTALISTTYYRYNDIGNVERVITEKANPQGEPQYSSVWLKYAKNGEAVSYVIGETWDDDCANTYEITYAREFRYDGARQRYLNRQLDPAALEAGNVVALSETWTDYDGNSPYADYTVDGSTLTQTAIYQPGIGRSFDPTDPAATEYYHTDQIGTTRLMTDTPGAGVSPNAVSESAFTAFGEQVGGTSQRYGYAGAYGYQTDDSTDGFPFLHVGARYYDPTAGRFLQRDPIGIADHVNVYGYVRNAPTRYVDPSGFGLFDWIYTGEWNPAPGVYEDAVDAAARHILLGKQPNYAKATAGIGGVVAGVAARRSGAGAWVVNSCAAVYGAWRLQGGSTGYSAIDSSLDWFAIGAGVGTNGLPIGSAGGGPKPLLWELF